MNKDTKNLLAKIFIIIGMVCGFWAILPLVFGFIALKKIKEDQMDTLWAVLTLLFVSLIGGIVLLIPDKE